MFSIYLMFIATYNYATTVLLKQVRVCCGWLLSIRAGCTSVSMSQLNTSFICVSQYMKGWPYVA